MSFSGSGFVLAMLSTVAILATANISYNSKTQLCCNGTVVNVGVNSSMFCCGSVPYDYSKSICCSNEILPSENARRSGCCYNQTTKTWTSYDYNLQMCCDGQAIDKPDPNYYEYGCCNGKLYNYTSHVCCGSEPQKMAPGEACCGEVKMYDTRSEICCTHYGYDEDFNFKVLDYVVSEGDASTSSCCGLKVYDLTTDMCCNGTVKEKVVKIGEVTWDPEGCCGDEPYDPNTQVCCSKRDPIKEPEIGLVKSVLHGIKNGSAMSCCGLALYNVQDEMCCTNDTVKPKPEGCNKDECMYCCGDMAITNYKTQVCYNEKVIEREDFNFMPCGDSGEMCDYRSQFCCDNKVYENNSTMACCYGANQAYDKTSHKCCFKTVEPLAEEDLEAGNDACCAVEFYD